MEIQYFFQLKTHPAAVYRQHYVPVHGMNRNVPRTWQITAMFPVKLKQRTTFFQWRHAMLTSSFDGEALLRYDGCLKTSLYQFLNSTFLIETVE